MFALPTTPDAVVSMASNLDDATIPELAPYVERFIIETGTIAASDGCEISPTNPWSLGHRDLSESFATWAAAQEAAAAPLVLSIDDEPAQDRTAQGRAIATMRRRVAEIEASNARLVRRADEAMRLLSDERQARRVFDDSHPDWRAFWTRAAMAANESGHCGEYDQICDSMGGVPRSEMTRTVTVTASISVDVEVPFAFRVRYNEDATEEGLESIRDAIARQAEYLDTSDLEIEDV